MDQIKDLLNNRTILIRKSRGAKYQWQDHAVRIAKKLGIKLSKNWFKLFRDAYKRGLKNILDSTYTAIVDLPGSNSEKYFFKVFWNKVNGSNGSNRQGQISTES